MAVKFEFTLDDIDASNLIDILHDAQVRVLGKAMEFIKSEMTNEEVAKVEWYKDHAAYLEELKQKVLAGNTQVEKF